MADDTTELSKLSQWLYAQADAARAAAGQERDDRFLRGMAEAYGIAARRADRKMLAAATELPVDQG